MTDPRGPSIPFRIDARTGSAVWSDGADKIREDVALLLGTRQGERPMMREYGCNVAGLVHEPDDDITADLLRRQAHEALLRWEPRIVVATAEVQRTDDGLELALQYVHTDAPVAGQMIVALTEH